MLICYDTENGRFSFRSVAVIIDAEHVLVQRNAEDDFWALPGGRVELFETSAEAVVREMQEELGLACKVQRQLWQVESFFKLSSHRFHELANYFLLSVSDQSNLVSAIDFKGIEISVELIFRWVPLKELACYNLKPEFLIENLIIYLDQ